MFNWFAGSWLHSEGGVCLFVVGISFFPSKNQIAWDW